MNLLIRLTQSEPEHCQEVGVFPLSYWDHLLLRSRTLAGTTDMALGSLLQSSVQPALRKPAQGEAEQGQFPSHSGHLLISLRPGLPIREVETPPPRTNDAVRDVPRFLRRSPDAQHHGTEPRVETGSSRGEPSPSEVIQADPDPILVSL